MYKHFFTCNKTQSESEVIYKEHLKYALNNDLYSRTVKSTLFILE